MFFNKTLYQVKVFFGSLFINFGQIIPYFKGSDVPFFSDRCHYLPVKGSRLPSEGWPMKTKLSVIEWRSKAWHEQYKKVKTESGFTGKYVPVDRSLSPT